MPEMSYRQLARIAPTTRSVHSLLVVDIRLTLNKNSSPGKHLQLDHFASALKFDLEAFLFGRMLQAIGCGADSKMCNTMHNAGPKALALAQNREDYRCVLTIVTRFLETDGRKWLVLAGN